MNKDYLGELYNYNNLLHVYIIDVLVIFHFSPVFINIYLLIFYLFFFLFKIPLKIFLLKYIFF